MEVKITLGAAHDAENWSKNFSGGPPARTSEFCFAPGGLQELSGDDFVSVLAAPWGPGGAQGVPGGLRQLILCHFGSLFASILAPSLGHLASSFGLRRGPPGGEKTLVLSAVRPPGALEKKHSSHKPRKYKQQRDRQQTQITTSPKNPKDQEPAKQILTKRLAKKRWSAVLAEP